MNEFGTVIEAHAIRYVRMLPGPIAEVWRYLTEPELRGRWLAAGEMELVVGGRVGLIFRHAELSSEATPERYQTADGSHAQHGTVTRIDPPGMLAFTWGGSARARSEVTFYLSERDDGVELAITHRQLHDREEMISVASGWHAHCCILADRLEQREPRPFWTNYSALEQEYRRRITAAAAALVKVTVARQYDASPERVFDAWLDPQQLSRWMFGPSIRNEQIVSLLNDPRPGGRFAYAVLRNGEQIDHIGEYLRIARPDQLVFTWGIASHTNVDSSRVTIDFAKTGDETELTLTHELHPAWADYAEQTEAGWSKMIEQLAAIFQKK